MQKDWIIDSPWSDCKTVATRWGMPPLVAQILHNRGLSSGDDPSAFLSPQLGDLIPPDQLPGACEAAKVIAESISRDERIVIYGDYDVDGITASAILWHVLKAAGADVTFYVPHRLEEGYGLSAASIGTLIADGAQLIISVDCGVTATEAAAEARRLGGRLIITDHHQRDETLPDALIVHPTVGGTYPNEHICGAGVAFKTAWAVARELSGSERVDERFKTLLHECLAFAALGTIADVVPLIGENRIIARYGLALLTNTPFVGLRVLIESARLVGNKVDAYDVGFRLGPRLNAAGRMGHARLAVELMTRADENRAREIALYLEEQNRSRQSTERKITKQAMEMIERDGLGGDGRRAIVLAHEDWHAGVIGIVASRIVDRYHRPTIVISLANGTGQGSGRSVKHFDLAATLAKCKEHLIANGGHAMAAGLKVESASVPAFTEMFTEFANNTLTAADLRAKLRIDAEVELAEMDLPTIEALLGLGPFGIGNPSPRLATGWLDLVDEPRCVGRGNAHVQVRFSDGRSSLKAIAFGKADMVEPLKKHRKCRVAFKPLINDFNGRRTVEMDVLDFQFPGTEQADSIGIA